MLGSVDSTMPRGGSLASRIRLGVIVVLLLTTTGCMRGCTSTRSPIHPNPNMDLQPKYRAQAESEFFYDGKTMRTPVEGTVARGELRADSAFFEGRDAAGNHIAANPLALDEIVVARGAERFGIYCAVCHGDNGNGKGVLWERAQVESADLLQQRLVDAPDGELFDTITNGLGLMSGYRYPIPAEDRWAIIAYVREMQRGNV